MDRKRAELLKQENVSLRNLLKDFKPKVKDTVKVDVTVMKWHPTSAAVPTVSQTVQTLKQTDFNRVVKVELLGWHMSGAEGNPDNTVTSGSFWADNVFVLDMDYRGLSDIKSSNAFGAPPEVNFYRPGQIVLPVPKPIDLAISSVERSKCLRDDFNIPRIVWEDPERRGIPIRNLSFELLRLPIHRTSEDGVAPISAATGALSVATYEELYLFLRFTLKSQTSSTHPTTVI